jgi:hypothetical protein
LENLGRLCESNQRGIHSTVDVEVECDHPGDESKITNLEPQNMYKNRILLSISDMMNNALQ